MKRGDIVLVRGSAGPAGKPRPCVIVQRSATLAAAPKITLCPLTSMLRLETTLRPIVRLGAASGLRRDSQIQIDWIYTYPADRIGPRIGSIDDDVAAQVDEALRLWLGL